MNQATRISIRWRDQIGSIRVWVQLAALTSATCFASAATFLKRDPVVDQTCNEGNCADEDCDGEKAAYEAALKKRIRLLLRLNRTFVRGWTQAALKAAQNGS